MYKFCIKMSEYQRYYSVGILDDLHNYFPAILYSHQFDDNELVSYIRSQARNRYDLFTRATNNHNRNREVVQIPGRMIPSRVHVDETHISSGNNDTIRVTYTTANNDEIESTTLHDDSLLNPLATLLTAALYPQTNNMMFPTLRRQTATNFMEPVVVRPTRQQINSGSTIVEVTNNTDNCAICQESLNQDNRQVRRLNACHHMFHDNCIIAWLNGSVRCPTCRHDIREE
jgi:hypothetical protein